ncbi:MAG: hypothetical protein WCQ77_04430 [Planctomycetota bacterium]
MVRKFRKFFVASAVIALVCSTTAAFAGGRSGSGKSSKQNVRIKNIGAQPVLVNAANGSATGAAGAKTTSPNGVSQFRLKRVASQAFAADTAQTVSDTLDYTFKDRVTVYLEAATDGTTATMTFANPGVLF